MRTLRTAFMVLLSIAITTSVRAESAGSFDSWFRDKTMRVDVFHTGGLGQEIVAIDRVVSDGPWAGSRTRLIDELNLGKFLYEVIDLESNRTIYTRGYASIYGEWETTPEANETHRTFHESLRLPWPKNKVQVVLKKRDAANAFQQIWSTNIDPNSRFVNPADLEPIGKVWTVFESGPAAQKVDLLILGDGYSKSEMEKFHVDVKKLVGKLFATEPFKSRKKDFNVRAIDLPTSMHGVHRPREGSNRRTPIATEYNIFDSERYALTHDNAAMRDIASAAPYEFIEILINEEKYGGGGIYNNQATCSVDTAFAEYVFVHEFGHHFAALADEYYVSPVSFETGAAEKPEPWEPNVTAMHDPAKLKWRDLMPAGTTVPTPWDKDTYEKHAREIQRRRGALLAAGAPPSELDALFREQQKWETPFLNTQKVSGIVGAFEGAAYEATGLYRPQTDCIMFTRDEVPFCKVCSRAIERVIDSYSRP